MCHNKRLMHCKKNPMVNYRRIFFINAIVLTLTRLEIKGTKAFLSDFLAYKQCCQCGAIFNHYCDFAWISLARV